MVVGEMIEEVDVLVIGAGPGGYTAALRASELGIKTMLVDAQPKPGGICLHQGCIPSKALLHAAEVINTGKTASLYGIHFEPPRIDLNQLRSWKRSITDKLADGIKGMCANSGVEIIHGRAMFEDSRNIKVDRPGESVLRIKFKHAVVATGSRPVMLPKLFAKAADMESPRILDSGSALEIKEIPRSLLIIGGGYIGLEMGTVYASLGSDVSVVEMTDGLLPGVDRDLVKPLATHLQKIFRAIYLNTKVVALLDTGKQIEVTFAGSDAPAQAKFDSVLVAIGRRPNTDGIGLENTGVQIDENGFIITDECLRTSDKRILAIGDVSGQPMLAHKAMRQGYVVAEVLAQKKVVFDNRAIPAVVFTEPEIAWCGLTETEAKVKGQAHATAKFPWSASGRAMTLNEPTGQTKVIFCPETTQVLGVGMVGARAGELIAEAVLAIEMGAMLEDLATTIHPHPTLSETVAEASIKALARLERSRSKERESKAGVI